MAGLGQNQEQAQIEIRLDALSVEYDHFARECLTK